MNEKNSKKNLQRSKAQTDELPPHREDAEWALIACCIEKPDILPTVDLDDLYLTQTREVFERMRDMQAKTLPINSITLPHSFIDDHPLMMAIVEALDTLPSPAGWPYWLDICRSYKIARGIQATRGELTEAAQTMIRDGTGGSIAEISRKLNELNKRESGAKFASELASETLEKLERGYSDPDSLRGLQTGFRDFDDATWGLHPGAMVVIAARPGVGKTAFACNIVEHLAVKNSVPVGVFSLEMTASQWTDRIVAGMSGVSLSRVWKRAVSEQDIQSLGLAAHRIKQAPLAIWDDTSNMQEIYAKALDAIAAHGLKLVVIDYLQRVQWPSNEGRWQQVGNISSSIKSLAMEAKVPVIALAQISRDVEKDGRIPRLSDLRESGSIEQDADVVGFLHPQECDTPDNKPVTLFIAKNRSGESQGKIDLLWRPSITKFFSVERDEWGMP